MLRIYICYVCLQFMKKQITLRILCVFLKRFLKNLTTSQKECKITLECTPRKKSL